MTTERDDLIRQGISVSDWDSIIYGSDWSWGEEQKVIHREVPKVDLEEEGNKKKFQCLCEYKLSIDFRIKLTDILLRGIISPVLRDRIEIYAEELEGALAVLNRQVYNPAYRDWLEQAPSQLGLNAKYLTKKRLLMQIVYSTMHYLKSGNNLHRLTLENILNDLGYIGVWFQDEKNIKTYPNHKLSRDDLVKWLEAIKQVTGSPHKCDNCRKDLFENLDFCLFCCHLQRRLDYAQRL